MPTALETTQEIQDKLYAGIEVSQRATVDVVRSWAETVETLFAKLPELAFSDPPKPSQALENAFGFTERVVAANRDFTTRLFEAVLPATRAATAGTQSAAAQANKVPGPKA